MDDPKKLEEGFGAAKHEVGTRGFHGEKDSRIESADNGEKEQQKQEQSQQMAVTKPKSKRIATLDAFRGLTIVVPSFLLLIYELSSTN